MRGFHAPMVGFAALAVALLGAADAIGGTPTKAAKLAAGPLNAQISNAAGDGVAHPEIWPAYHYPAVRNPKIEAKISALLRRMTLEEKVGQVMQADIGSVTPQDMARYHLGSVLNGGSSGPYGDDLAAAPKWLQLADELWSATQTQSGVKIPPIWGIDAVHGHSNIIGATLFPHNIGLGATRNPALIQKIGAATATEIRVTGQEWTFAPTVTVPQDYRWGRSYEGYSSDPAVVSSLVGAMVRGLQGPGNKSDILGQGKVLASTKHFLADGGTQNGVDQGNAAISEKDLRDIHGKPYGPAVSEGVGSVMASFSSWQGKKMTGNKSLLTGVLKERMGFDGFIVSDWNAHGQVEGCTNNACPQALLAGLDMYMAPDSWKPVWENLLAEAKAGRIPQARLDDAVRRILRVKYRLGLMDAPKPSARALSGQWNLLGAPQHRAIARQAVRESLVLLKNQGVLPLKAGGRLLVAGEGADDIARQAGGWTISWQGTGLNNSQFPGATSLWKGFKESVESAGGTAEYSPEGKFSVKPDAAVVVFGEKPYAEFQGDRKTLQLDPELSAPIEIMRKLKAQGIPVVAVLLSGRPLFMNPALNVADAFVAAWLPGSEGGGVADVLVGDKAGKARFGFKGTLPTAWPAKAKIGDGALYPLGYGLRYAAAAKPWQALSEEPGVAATGDARVWFAKGVPAASWSLVVGDGQGGSHTRITAVPASALDGQVSVSAEDFQVQEGARRFVVKGGEATVMLRNLEPQDIARETNGDVRLVFTMKANQPSDLTLAMDKGVVPLKLISGAGFKRYGIALRCFANAGVDMAKVGEAFVLRSKGAADFSIADVRLATDADEILPCGQ